MRYWQVISNAPNPKGENTSRATGTAFEHDRLRLIEGGNNVQQNTVLPVAPVRNPKTYTHSANVKC